MRSVACLGVAAIVGVGCQTEPFGCESDDQCQVDSAAGVCETNGYCSFADPECPSGRRYSDLAGGGLAGLCVNAPMGSTGGEGSTGVGSTSAGSTSINPMTGLTTELTSAGSSSSGTDESGSSGSSSSTTSDESSESTGGPVGIDDGLVVYVDFDSPPQDDGGLPTPAGTLSASCNNVDGECPDLVPGVVGSAGRFDGVDDAVFVADAPALALADALTLSLWSRRLGPFDPYALLAGKAFGDGGSNSYEMYLTDASEAGGTYVVNFSTDTPSAFGNAFTEVNDDWTHVCGVWDGSVWRLYVNGVQAATQVVETAPTYDEHPFIIGADMEFGAVTHFFDGTIDEVRLYDRALSPGEVVTLYEAG